MLKDYLSKGCVFEVLRKRRFEVNVNQMKKSWWMKAAEWNIKSRRYWINGKETFVLQNMKTYNLDFCKKHSLERGHNNNKDMIHMTIFLSSQIFREKKKWVSICIFAFQEYLCQSQKWYIQTSVIAIKIEPNIFIKFASKLCFIFEG